MPRPTLCSALSVLLAGALTFAGCAPRPEAALPPDVAGSATDTGWTDLGDLQHWRGFGRADVPGGWRLDDGAIHFSPGGEGGDLVSRAEYGDFELVLEWKIGPCGNSGIFYRGAEGEDAIWRTAPEMQVLDDTCHPDARFPSHTAGSLYDLYVPDADAVRPAGAWNEVRIVARGAAIEHWLNGVKIGTYEQGGASWNARVAASKFRDMPGFGTLRTGHFALQDHGDPVWYRNIRVRPLG